MFWLISFSRFVDQKIVEPKDDSDDDVDIGLDIDSDFNTYAPLRHVYFAEVYEMAS